MITSNGLLPDPEKVEAVPNRCEGSATIGWIRELPGVISATCI